MRPSQRTREYIQSAQLKHFMRPENSRKQLNYETNSRVSRPPPCAGEEMKTDIPEELAKDPWFKIVEFLQQNWAVVIQRDDDVLAVFYGDTCGVFDEIAYPTREEAEQAPQRNGFSKFLKDDRAQEFIGLPRGEFKEQAHPNGRIYSSGRFWH